MSLFESLELFFDRVPRCAAVNMAMDEILLEEISVPRLRVYGWQRPAASFGYFEKYSDVAAAHKGRELVRRWTGGGVVLHGEDFTYSILVPRDAQFMRLGAAESYRTIHERLAGAMRESGIPARVAETTAPKVSQACFENPVQHDVLLGDRKVAGAAQRRTKCGLLHQGSILMSDLPGDFGQRLADRLAASVVPGEIGADRITAATALAGARYGTDQWLKKF